MPLIPSPRHCSNKYKLAREGEKDKEKDEDFEKVIFFLLLLLFLWWSQVELKEMSFQLLRSAGHQRLHRDFWLKLMGKLLMNLTESWSHAVELELQRRQGAQYLPGWAVDDVLSSMPRCPPGSLRSVQLPLDHLVEMRDRAVCHQRRNGRRSHVPV